MSITQKDKDIVRGKFENLSIKYLAMSGVYLDLIEERHVRLVMPLGEIHINHVGTAYAGSIFILAEVASSAFMMSIFGAEKYIPIASKAEIEYLKPTKKDLVADLSISEQEAEELIKPIEERGKGRVPLTIPISDKDGEIIANAKVVLYLLPAGEKFVK